MKKDKDRQYADRDIEDLLSPKCDFRTSSDFTERLMEKARSQSAVRGRRKNIRFWMVTTAVAASAVIAIISVVVRVATSEQSKPAEVCYREVSVASVAAGLQPAAGNDGDTRVANPRGLEMSKRTHEPCVPTWNDGNARVTNPQEIENTYVPAETEGELPMAKTEYSLDPDSVRVRMLAAERDAQLAFIERMRSQIEENEAMISRYMASVNE